MTNEEGDIANVEEDSQEEDEEEDIKEEERIKVKHSVTDIF